MFVLRWAAAAVLCALTIVPTATAQQASAPADPTHLPAPAAKYEKVWPRLLPDPKAAEAEQPLVEWTKQEIELAQARCTALLKGLDVVAVPDAPLKEADECGTAAPMRLISIGNNPQIALSPPPTLTCDMIAALHKWLKQEVQPLARKHLGAPVVSVAAMSSYSCRNAYGRTKGRLSEHGRANALDVAGFATVRGQATYVLADWGPIAREIAAQAAAAQKQRDAATAKAAAEQKPGGQKPTVQQQPSPVPVTAQQLLRPSIGIELPGIAVQPSSGDAPSAAFGLTQPSRLGGPKQDENGGEPTAATEPLTAKAKFLREVHRSACKVFGTVLGPEANNAHKNHFHLDMAERKHGVICE